MRDGTKPDEAAKKPRGRPRAYEPEVALQQATDAFWKAGYSGTSLDDISAATGMNRPSLRAAFGDKHAIYVKALSNYWEIHFAAMREALKGGRALDETLMSVYDAVLSIYFSGDDRARGCFAVGTAVTEAVNDPEIRGIVAEGFHMLDADFEARLRSAREAGELKKDADPEALAVLASATMHTLAIRARSGTSHDDLRKLALKAVSVICG
jgi:TetR/AcrR family transcriptional regulator, copper-responsive repressor